MADHRLRLIEKKPKKEKFVICGYCRKQHPELLDTIWWWAKSECSVCGRKGSELYKEYVQSGYESGNGLVVASKERRKNV